MMAEKVTIGNCELWHGDCMDYMRGLPDKAFDLAIVDPPYGIGADVTQAEFGGRKGFGKNAGHYRVYHETDWDNSAPTKEYFDELSRVSSEQIIWGGNYFDLNLSGVIVWYKGGSGTWKEGELAKTTLNTFRVFQYSRADAYINHCDVKIHPTQKPVKLYEWLLTNYAKQGQRILDTHLGSGSSAIAANGLGFDFVGVELDEDYYAAACRRIEQAYAQPRLFEDAKVGAGETAVQGDMLLPANLRFEELKYRSRA